MKKNQPFRFLLLTGVLTCSCATLAWGKLGHELVAEVGAELSQATRFYHLNAQAMRVHTNTPDNVWKVGANRLEESTTHWFEPDAYTDDVAEFPLFPRQYSQAVRVHGSEAITDHGTAPWRILQTFDQAVEALKGRNWVKALQMAGVMSHYVGDLSQPLHVTTNYDGQETNQKGVHSWFESSNLGRFAREEIRAQVLTQARALLASTAFRNQFNGKVVDVAFNEVLRSYRDKEAVLQTDIRFGRKAEGSKAQIVIAVRRMADGAATLALLLDRMWMNSGLREFPGASVEVPVPAFLKPAYYDEGTSRRRILKQLLNNNVGDEHAGSATHSGHEDHDCLAP